MTTDEQIAEQLAGTLMAHVVPMGPLQRIAALGRLLRTLRQVVRIVTEYRDIEARAATAVFSQRKLAQLTGMTTSSMQKICESGARLAPQVQDGECDPDDD